MHRYFSSADPYQQQHSTTQVDSFIHHRSRIIAHCCRRHSPIRIIHRLVPRSDLNHTRSRSLNSHKATYHCGSHNPPFHSPIAAIAYHCSSQQPHVHSRTPPRSIVRSHWHFPNNEMTCPLTAPLPPFNCRLMLSLRFEAKSRHYLKRSTAHEISSC